jgi:hypothetical protein
MSEAPTWKKLYDRFDSTVGTRLNDFVRSDDFATLVALARRGQREVEARGERVTRRVLHSVNLPAGSDVNRLLVQIGSLEREVRELRNRLSDAESRSTRSAQNGSGESRSGSTRAGQSRSGASRSGAPRSGQTRSGATSSAPPRAKGATRSGTNSRTRSSPRSAAS